MRYPTRPSHPFYQQFDDPLKAYSTLPMLYKFFRADPARALLPDSESHVRRAWQDVHAPREEDTP